MPVTWHEERGGNGFGSEHMRAWAWRVCCVVLFFSKIKIHILDILKVKFYVFFFLISCFYFHFYFLICKFDTSLSF